MIFIDIDPEPGCERIAWRRGHLDVPEPIALMDPDRWAAVCIAVKREANRRERENGFRMKLEEETPTDYSDYEPDTEWMSAGLGPYKPQEEE